MPETPGLQNLLMVIRQLKAHNSFRITLVRFDTGRWRLQIYWNVMLCRWTSLSESFEWSYCLQLHGQVAQGLDCWDSLTLTIKTLGPFKSSGSTCPMIRPALQLKRLESSAMQLWKTKVSLPRIIFVMGINLQKHFMRNNYLHAYGEYIWTVTCGLNICGSVHRA